LASIIPAESKQPSIKSISAIKNELQRGTSPFVELFELKRRVG
jgi:hypothetical protein